MKLVVVSHKECWRSAASESGFATDGGFPFQMQALSEHFDETTLVLPCARAERRNGEGALRGKNLTVVPLTPLEGTDGPRKLRLPAWLVRNAPALLAAVRAADAVHAPVPGDVGTLGMLAAYALGKPLFVRYCGNWTVQRTSAERFWRRFMERHAGGRNVMLATGGATTAPSANPAIEWIFATSMTEAELEECAVRDRRAPADGAPRLIAVGRQTREKGTGLLIEALARTRASYPGATLDVVGGGQAIGELEALAATLGLAEAVRFHGNVGHDRVLELLRGADLFCQPSESEGFPKSVLEALACGLPVVVTNVSVLPTLVGSGCGVLLDERTPESVAQAIVACLGDPARYAGMSAKAAATARDYSLERWASAIGTRLRAAWGETLSHA
jgi:glycosyltransferase involved in cell wall biosynthesis